MLKLILLLIVTLFIQVNSWKTCSNAKCFLEETFENCNAFDECITTGSKSYRTVMQYYDKAYRVHEATHEDTDDPELDRLYEAFNKQIDAGPRRCRYFKEMSILHIPDEINPMFHFFKVDKKDANMQEECKKFQQALESKCETARKSLIAMDNCNITAEFEKQIVDEWKKCVDLSNI